MCALGFNVIADLEERILKKLYHLRSSFAIDKATVPSFNKFCQLIKEDEDENEESEDEATKKRWADLTAKLKIETNSRLKTKCKSLGLVVGGNKSELVARIVQKERLDDRRRRQLIPLRELSEPELLTLQQVSELLHEVQVRRDDLLEYRSHLARHLSEDGWARQETEELKDDEVNVTSDYKMKILSCFFRENQKKWFGKRGTSLLGFMVTTNPRDDEEGSKAKGEKDVFFVMLLTDDTLQDDWEVAVGKRIVYEEYLPSHVTKVRFTSDGAGCFRGQLQRAIQPFWIIWTGIDEISYRITPAGDGKSALDGMFGRLNVVLRSQVNNGDSYYDMDTISDTIQNSNGMAGTEFARFKPERAQQLQVEMKGGANFESVLLTTLDPDRQADKQVITSFKHSGYGTGKEVDLATCAAYFWRIEKKSGGSRKKGDATRIDDIYNLDVSVFVTGVCFSMYYSFAPNLVLFI
jgi:hypothetical protein